MTHDGLKTWFLPVAFGLVILALWYLVGQWVQPEGSEGFTEEQRFEWIGTPLQLLSG